jgi:hypothetical protein
MHGCHQSIYSGTQHSCFRSTCCLQNLWSVIETCPALSSSAVTAYQSGLPLFSNDGRTLIGCTVTSTSCPATFPVYFQSAATPPVIQRCQAAIADGFTCSTVSSCTYPVQVTGVNNTIVGCQAASCTCSNGHVTLSLTVDGPAVGCSSSTSACMDPN